MRGGKFLECLVRHDMHAIQVNILHNYLQSLWFILQTNKFLKIGMLLVMSVTRGGGGHPFFAKSVFSLSLWQKL